MATVDVGDGPTERGARSVQIQLLGRFQVVVDDLVVPTWTRKHPAHLVKLLALQPHHRMHREQVLDLLWPDDPLDIAGAQAAQGRPLRPQADRGAERNRAARRRRGVVPGHAPDGRRRGLRARCHHGAGRRRRRAGGGGGGPPRRRSAPGRPLRGVAGDTPRSPAPPAPRAAAAAAPLGRRAATRAGRRGGARRPDGPVRRGRRPLPGAAAVRPARSHAARRARRAAGTARPMPSATASSPPRRSPRGSRRCSSGARRSWPPSSWRWEMSPPATPRSWCSPARPAAASRRCCERPSSGPPSEGGGSGPGPWGRPTAHGPTPRCSKPSPTSAVATPRCSTASPTSIAPRSIACWPGSTRRGTATARTSGCSSPSPSCSASPARRRARCWRSTTSTTPTTPPSGCCTTSLAPSPTRGSCCC